MPRPHHHRRGRRARPHDSSWYAGVCRPRSRAGVGSPHRAVAEPPASTSRAMPSGDVMGARVPPVVVLAAAGAAQRLTGRRRKRTARSVLASTVTAGLSGALILESVVQFARHRTTVDPHGVESASTLVTTGPHALTRNPMYVGMLGLLVARAVARRRRGALLPAAGFWWAMTASRSRRRSAPWPSASARTMRTTRTECRAGCGRARRARTSLRRGALGIPSSAPSTRFPGKAVSLGLPAASR